MCVSGRGRNSISFVGSSPRTSCLRRSESALATMKSARSLMENVDAQVKPLSSSTEDTMAEARAVLANLNKTLGEDSALLHQLAVLMEEFTEAAQAIRLLADYIERHPEALITGKGD